MTSERLSEGCESFVSNIPVFDTPTSSKSNTILANAEDLCPTSANNFRCANQKALSLNSAADEE